MSYVHTQEDVDLIFQHHQEVYNKIDLLNNQMKVIVWILMRHQTRAELILERWF